MSKWNDFYENWVVRFLVKEPLKHGSYFLSHGFSHFLMCLTVFSVTFWLAEKNAASSETTMHNVYLEVKAPYWESTLKDTMTYLCIEFTLDSDTLFKKTDNKYSSRIRVSYLYDYSNRDSEFVDAPQLPTKIKLYSDPFPDDLMVEQECNGVGLHGEPYVFETHYTSEQLPDSSVEISVIPAANVKDETGGPDGIGTQDIYMYSNKLGLSENDSYYNYFIDLSRLPLVKDINTSTDGAMIRFQIGDLTTNKSFQHVENKRLLYQYVYPQPDIIANGYLEYFTDETISKVIKNQGIIIQAADIDAMNKNSRRSIMYSVLVGTGAALIFDILIQLVRELTNVNRRKDREEEECRRRSEREAKKEEEPNEPSEQEK